MVDLGSISGRSRADLGSISQANYVDFAMLSRLSNVDHNTSTYSNDRCAKSEIKEELSRMAAGVEWGTEWASPMVRNPSDRSERAKVRHVPCAAHVSTFLIWQPS